MDHFNFRSQAFLPAVRRAKLRRIRVHDLRHGAASYLIAAGVDIATVSRQLGHANVAITLSTYTHWVQSRAGTDHTSKLEAYLAEKLLCIGCRRRIGRGIERGSR